MARSNTVGNARMYPRTSDSRRSKTSRAVSLLMAGGLLSRGDGGGESTLRPPAGRPVHAGRIRAITRARGSARPGLGASSRCQRHPGPGSALRRASAYRASPRRTRAVLCRGQTAMHSPCDSASWSARSSALPRRPARSGGRRSPWRGRAGRRWSAHRQGGPGGRRRRSAPGTAQARCPTRGGTSASPVRSSSPATSADEVPQLSLLVGKVDFVHYDELTFSFDKRRLRMQPLSTQPERQDHPMRIMLILDHPVHDRVRQERAPSTQLHRRRRRRRHARSAHAPATTSTSSTSSRTDSIR